MTEKCTYLKCKLLHIKSKIFNNRRKKVLFHKGKKDSSWHISSFALFQKIAERSRALLPPAQKDKNKVSWYESWKSTLCFTVIHKRAGWWDGISMLDCILTRAPLKLCLGFSTANLMHWWFYFFRVFFMDLKRLQTRHTEFFFTELPLETNKQNKKEKNSLIVF